MHGIAARVVLPVMLPVLLALTNMTLTASEYTTLAVAVERLLSVKRSINVQ